jgi:hypothetical protein
LKQGSKKELKFLAKIRDTTDLRFSTYLNDAGLEHSLDVVHFAACGNQGDRTPTKSARHTLLPNN